jgi:hypothetical protein
MIVVINSSALESNLNQEKFLYVMTMETEVNGLIFQLERILKKSSHERLGKISPVHDVDFYLILLRRLLRKLEEVAKTDSRVANLKGKHKELFKKIKIRDHFEHGIDFETLPSVGNKEFPGIKVGSGTKIATSLIGNLIVSGDLHWDLFKDHTEFIDVILKMVDLYPYNKENNMNEHLNPIFEIILPILENHGIEYWVYGGVSIAGMNKKWIRYNQDTDVAVLDRDFEESISILISTILSNKWSTRLSHLRNGRPKLDIYLKSDEPERFSLIPLYKATNQIEFKFGKIISLPISVLARQKRTIDNHSFFTFKDEYVKQLLIHYLQHHKVEPGDKKYKDAIAVLSKEELAKFLPSS